MADILYGVKLVVLTELDEATGLAKVGADPIYVDTAEEVELDPVISNGEEKVLRDDTRILAIASTPDLLYGYNLKLKDATFKSDVASLIEGAIIRYKEGSQTEVEGYDTPMLSEGATMKPFKADIYVANYEGESIVNYVKITLNNCRGKAPKMSLKKDFFSPEFEIKARENTKAKLRIKNVDYVSTLPVQA
jgi:hypothetical protein